MSKTKIEHRGMKNEIQQVGYWKQKLTYGVSETRFKVWGTENENSKQGHYAPIQGQGVSSSERLGIEYLKRVFEIRHIVLSQFKRGTSDFRI